MLCHTAAKFDEINAASYAAVDDSESNVPAQLIYQCKNKNVDSSQFEEVNVVGGGRVDVAHVKQFCTENSICIIPYGTTLEITDNLNVAALIVRGAVEWDDSTSPENTFVCAGYVAVEGNGLWNMNLQSKSAWIYIKDNGAYHPMLRTRSFGGAAMNEGDSPEVNIEGRKLERTWSLLAEPLSSGDTKMNLLHNPILMGWRVGDRIGIAPTEKRSSGFGEEFRIESISGDGSITLDKEVQNNFMAEFAPPLVEGGQPILKSAEVVNLDRNIVITGDDFRHIDCDASLSEAIPGEQTSVAGCRCSSFRSKCTMGLHTIHMHGGVARIQSTRVEKCGQRGEQLKWSYSNPNNENQKHAPNLAFV